MRVQGLSSGLIMLAALVMAAGSLTRSEPVYAVLEPSHAAALETQVLSYYLREGMQGSLFRSPLVSLSYVRFPGSGPITKTSR